MIALNEFAAPRADAKQKTDESSRLSFYSGGIWPQPWEGLTTQAGVSAVNGFFPIWSYGIWGTYPNYRVMCRHATIAFVLSQILAPPFAGAASGIPMRM